MRLLVAREDLHVIEEVVGAFTGRGVGGCGGGCGGEVELFEEGDGDVRS